MSMEREDMAVDRWKRKRDRARDLVCTGIQKGYEVTKCWRGIVGRGSKSHSLRDMSTEGNEAGGIVLLVLLYSALLSSSMMLLLVSKSRVRARPLKPHWTRKKDKIATRKPISVFSRDVLNITKERKTTLLFSLLFFIFLWYIFSFNFL